MKLSEGIVSFPDLSSNVYITSSRTRVILKSDLCWSWLGLGPRLLGLVGSGTETAGVGWVWDRDCWGWLGLGPRLLGLVGSGTETAGVGWVWDRDYCESVCMSIPSAQARHTGSCPHEAGADGQEGRVRTTRPGGVSGDGRRREEGGGREEWGGREGGRREERGRSGEGGVGREGGGREEQVVRCHDTFA